MGKRLKILIVCIAIAVICFEVISIISTIKKSTQTIKNEETKDLSSIQKLSSTDSLLFSEKWCKKIKVITVWLSAIRNPLSITTFDEKYYVLFHRLDLKLGFSLHDSLKMLNSDAAITNDIAYRVFKIDDYFEFDFSSREIDPISSINITVNGDSILKVLNTDSVISYHVVCTSASLRCKPTDVVDVYLGTDQSFAGNNKIAADLLFWQRGKSVYFFIMLPINPKETIDENLISKILRLG